MGAVSRAMDNPMNQDLVLVEILDNHGRVQLRERIELAADKRSFTIGRAVTADVPLTDPHVAPLHASVHITPEGTIAVTDLNSVNGIVIDGKRYSAAQHPAAVPLPHGGRSGRPVLESPPSQFGRSRALLPLDRGHAAVWH